MENISTMFFVIPGEVALDAELPFGARVFYGMLCLYSHKTGYCFATNRHFEQELNVSRRTINNWLTALIDGGYVSVEQHTPDGVTYQRRIRVHLKVRVNPTKST